MSLSSINFDDISERDLLDQIQAGVPEGVLIDYKQNLYGRTDADVKEFLKDVSSFGNTAGGHLIIGVHETAGVPTGISALSGDPDLQRLENLARDGIEPRIAGLRMMCRSPPAALFWFCASRGVESMHWLLDVEFGDDLSRYRTGHGAKNMAIVRRFALGLVRANNRKGSVKTRRKRAGWDPKFLLEILQLK